METQTHRHKQFFIENSFCRLLLVCPTSSCEAERSFSALRRLKTWLRNTMSQQRLISVAVCHIHQDRLDALDLKAIAREFATKSATRKHEFGSFQ